jgi:hypothetical protein
MKVSQMGLLMDIRSRKRGNAGAGAIVFWFVAGSALGFGAIWMLPSVPASSLFYLLVLPGVLLGAMVGFYAAWGTSRLARFLAIPGMIVDFIR